MTEKEKFDARLAKMKAEDGLVSMHISAAEGVDRDSEEFWSEVNRWQDKIEAGEYEPIVFGDSKGLPKEFYLNKPLVTGRSKMKLEDL